MVSRNGKVSFQLFQYTVCQRRLKKTTVYSTISKTNFWPYLKETLTLHQNFPNSFNPITTLRYDLPKESNVKLAIYNMLGTEVATLVNSNQKAGFKSVHWDATDSMGRPVSAGEFVQTKKMVLLK